MRTKEEVNLDYNKTALLLGHLSAQIHLRDTETSELENHKNVEIVKIEKLMAELKEIEKHEARDQATGD